MKDTDTRILSDIYYTANPTADSSLTFYSYNLPPSNLPIALPFIFKPESEDESKLIEQKKAFHNALILDEKPLLKIYLSREKRPAFTSLFTGKLEAIHKHCLGKKCITENSIVETVKGNYYYFHYLQDGEMDSGWGCAYRSLQTLISWYIAQGYGQIKVPTIKEIQKALAELKDKPAKFVGTNEWIGAYEVMLCLNYFLKVRIAIKQKYNRQ